MHTDPWSISDRMPDTLISILSENLPGVFRWAGAIARQLRGHDISLSGKASGFADTDALTLADLSVQELLVSALRDMGPVVRSCRIEAEEASGDLGRFAAGSEWTIGIDPIDGTRLYRDHTGNGYGVLLHTPNVYDFPVYLHLARSMGGDAVRVHDGRRVDFESEWRDARANMLRLPGIVACAVDPGALSILTGLARDWSQDRYAV